MKPTLLTSLTLFVGLTDAAYPRFKKYEECVSHCDGDSACRASYWDTITGDCQVHECISGQTPPDRFEPYIKAPAEYCPGVSPPPVTEASTDAASAVVTSTTTPGVGAGVGVATSTGAGTEEEGVSTTGSSPAATETSGAEAGLGALRVDVGAVAAVGCVVVGLLG